MPLKGGGGGSQHPLLTKDPLLAGPDRCIVSTYSSCIVDLNDELHLTCYYSEPPHACNNRYLLLDISKKLEPQPDLSLDTFSCCPETEISLAMVPPMTDFNYPAFDVHMRNLGISVNFKKQSIE